MLKLLTASVQIWLRAGLSRAGEEYYAILDCPWSNLAWAEQTNPVLRRLFAEIDGA